MIDPSTAPPGLSRSGFQLLWASACRHVREREARHDRAARRSDRSEVETQTGSSRAEKPAGRSADDQSRRFTSFHAPERPVKLHRSQPAAAEKALSASSHGARSQDPDRRLVVDSSRAARLKAWTRLALVMCVRHSEEGAPIQTGANPRIHRLNQSRAGSPPRPCPCVDGTAHAAPARRTRTARSRIGTRVSQGQSVATFAKPRRHLRTRP